MAHLSHLATAFLLFRQGVHKGISSFSDFVENTIVPRHIHQMENITVNKATPLQRVQGLEVPVLTICASDVRLR
jgi:hypothetical protein